MLNSPYSQGSSQRFCARQVNILTFLVLLTLKDKTYVWQTPYAGLFLFTNGGCVMGFSEFLLIAVGLSMDAFAVAVCKGLKMRQLDIAKTAVIALFFGGFQALMPLLGWALGKQFEHYITSIDHWITFFLLLFIGGKMIIESFKKDKDSEEKPEYEEKLDLKELTLMAVATSIDALAVGVTYAFLQVNILTSITVIGSVTFILSALGVGVGHKFGAKYKNKAELCGGIILVLIGIKILLEHLGVLNF